VANTERKPSEREIARYAIYASVRGARKREREERTSESPDPLAFRRALLPKEMARKIVEFKLGVVQVV
jgi:hypothetical protein